jgi:hypothetical protein
VLTLVVSLALALAAPAASPATATTLPKLGVLAPGQSLAGARLGDTTGAVRTRWGAGYKVCTVCPALTWLYMYPDRFPTGVAVTFRNGRASAIFTLGSPIGWKTTKGLRVGAPVEAIDELYGTAMHWSRCIGYGALSSRKGSVVTSIYTHGESVYGFALTRPSEPVCQ